MIIPLLILLVVLFFLLLIDIIYLHLKIERSYNDLTKTIFKLKEDIMVYLLDEKRSALIKTLIMQNEEPQTNKRSDAAKRMWEKRKSAKKISQQTKESSNENNSNVEN
jgi:hypothetical protein